MATKSENSDIAVQELIDLRGWKPETVMAVFPEEATGPNGGLRRKQRLPHRRVIQAERTKRFQRLQDQHTYLSSASILARNWTQTQIDTLLGEPDKTAPNPHYKSAAEMRLFSLARIQKIETTPAFQAQQAKTIARREAARAKEEQAARTQAQRQAEAEAQRRAAASALNDALSERMESRWGSRQFLSMFPLARRLGRQLRLFVGPTNSGKTHAAMERLKDCASAVYLAPLRLLALEGRDRIESMGIPCTLLTGEEQQVRDGAQATASTIEMLDERSSVDIAIIDEIQMLHDPDRGWAWVNALVGAPAREVVMTGSDDAIPAVKAIAEYLEEPLEIVRFERHNPLELDRSPTPLSDLKPHTALIAFSRREVLDLRSQLTRMGRSVAVIYGALGPEVRREEARRFRDGEAEILVATDAIGMGLNLPIRHVVFWTTVKWDGRKEDRLSPALARQIAGRAGRYGMHDTGHAGAVTAHDLAALQRLLEGSLSPGKLPLSVLPSPAQIDMLQDLLDTRSLVRILRHFSLVIGHQESLFRAGSMEEMLVLADAVDHHAKLSLPEKYTLCLAPVNQRSPSVLGAWDRFVRAVLKKESLPAPDTGRNYARGIATNTDHLQGAEDAVQIQNLYRWLAYRFPAVFPQIDESTVRTRVLNDFIVRSLRAGSLARPCASCGTPLPVSHRFPMCDPCFRSNCW